MRVFQKFNKRTDAWVKYAKKSDGTAKYLFPGEANAVAFLRNRLSCTFFRMRSSACRMNNGRLLTKVVSVFSV